MQIRRIGRVVFDQKPLDDRDNNVKVYDEGGLEIKGWDPELSEAVRTFANYMMGWERKDAEQTA